MSVQLRPLGDRVLIKPDQAPTVTASGLHLAEHPKPEQTGTVLAVGRHEHPRKADIESLAQRLSNAAEWSSYPSLYVETIELLRELVSVEPSVQPGDYVVFSWAAGQSLRIDDQDGVCLVLRESDLLCVVGQGVSVEPMDPNREVAV